jgi:hypothetical protein
VRAAVLIFGVISAAAILAASPNPVPAEWTDIDGHTHRLADRSAGATVFIFVLADCPAANRYAPEINRLCSDFPKVRFFVVHADAIGAKAARRHAIEHRLKAGVVIDSARTLAHGLGAKMSPEAVVVLPDGSTAYRGRIDNRLAALGRERPRPTRHDLRNALEAVAAGRSPDPRETEVVGCHLPR